MASHLSGRLSAFIVDEDSLDNSLANETNHVSTRKVLDSIVKSEDEEETAPAKAKRKKSDMEKARELDKQVSSIGDDRGYEVFDQYFDSYAQSDEDVGLRNSLISQGRKYARDTKVSAETSELVRAFSATEKKLEKMVSDVDVDIQSIQRDIDMMRAMRTGRNNKVLTDMEANKKEYYNVQLQAIKEINNMKKSQFDLQLKINKEREAQAGSEDSEGLINRAIGSLFGNNRSEILGSIGGYSGVSGALGADEDVVPTSEDSNDEDSESAIFTSGDDDRMDGETAYLKYENVGAHLVVTEHADHTYTVTAEDRDGNTLPDYPLPTNANHLAFEVNEKFGTARDDYHRKYTYRKDYDDE